MSVVEQSNVPTGIKKVVFWDAVEHAGIEEYDEAFLASLRTELKTLEADEKKVIIVPRRFSNTADATFWGCAASEVMNEESELEFFEAFTSAMVHLARRIKDCKNVLGFEYPNFNSDWEVLGHYSSEYKEKFMAAFQKKHSHYIFID